MSVGYRFALAPLFLLSTSCLSVQVPYAFTAPGDTRAVVNTAARILAAQGHGIGRVDRRTGVITSVWEAYAQANTNGVFVHRYTLVVGPTVHGSSNVTVRMNVANCPPGGFTVGDVEVRGVCTPIQGIFPGDQKDIDELGAQLRAALGQGPA